jgi:hypothetical protein
MNIQKRRLLMRKKYFNFLKWSFFGEINIFEDDVYNQDYGVKFSNRTKYVHHIESH